MSLATYLWIGAILGFLNAGFTIGRSDSDDPFDWLTSGAIAFVISFGWGLVFILFGAAAIIIMIKEGEVHISNKP